MSLFGAPTGTYFNDPRLLQRWYAGGAGQFGVFQITTARVDTTSNFFAELGARGTAVDTNWTAASKKTILTSSSPTLLYGVVGPAQGVGETAIYEIIVDGVTYVLPTSPAALAGGRTLLGPTIKSGFYTSADINLGTQNASVAPIGGWELINQTVGYMPPPITFDPLGIPRLYARQSLTVSITVSANITGTSNQERQSGVAYRIVA